CAREEGLRRFAYW
nr:immunoglobulin heavy chain junction region [Mus musculus]